MKVYCVLCGIPYEGNSLESVWSTKEAAEEEAERLQGPVANNNWEDYYVYEALVHE
jgi:hypothetical protein